MDNNKTKSSNTFPKAEKLKSRKAIDGLFKSGKSFFIHPYKVFFQIADGRWQMADGGAKKNQCQQIADNNLSTNVGNEMGMNNNNQPQTICRKMPFANHQLPTVQVGFAVSTKNFKHAVDRNRIKRLGREAYRLNKHPLVLHLEDQHLQLQVFFVFTNKSLPTFAQVQLAMQACLRKLIKTTKKDEGLLQG